MHNTLSSIGEGTGVVAGGYVRFHQGVGELLLGFTTETAAAVVISADEMCLLVEALAEAAGMLAEDAVRHDW